MKLRYDELKTTNLAAEFLNLAGGSMPYLKLMKLLYLADRIAFDQYGSPITGDYYVSMDYGPVLSRTYDIMKNPPEPGKKLPGEIWNKHISKLNYDVNLASPFSPSLSDADRSIAKKVFDDFGDHDQWTIAELTHDFPEWRNPKGSALPIDYEDILIAIGKSKGEAEEILSRLSMKSFLQDYAEGV